MKARTKVTPMKNYIWILSFILLSGFVFGITLKNEDPNKDKLLLEIISYVLDRGHYDPKEINDAFSENVYVNYLDNLDGQRRFFLNADIRSFESYRYKVDDELKNAQINFFNLTYNKLTERMKQVEGFYKELLEKPFDFNKKEEINLDYENTSYAKSIPELKMIWRRHLLQKKKKKFKRKNKTKPMKCSQTKS